jgi:uncharacterized protein (TIGR03083 family)
VSGTSGGGQLRLTGMVESWDVARDVPPLDLRILMREERQELVILLSALDAQEWQASAVGRWDVHAVTLHLLGNDLRSLPNSRPQNQRSTPSNELGYTAIAEIIERENDEWVDTARRIIPALLPEVLVLTGRRVDDQMACVDMNARSTSVGWSGSGPSPEWLHIAREYTERWVHHQQIRDAVGRDGLKERKWLHPVLQTMLLALPRAYEYAQAPTGTTVSVVVDGPAGGTWRLTRAEDRWHLATPIGPAEAEVHIPEDVAWRVLSRNLRPENAAPLIERRGSVELTEPILNAVAIMTTT